AKGVWRRSGDARSHADSGRLPISRDRCHASLVFWRGGWESFRRGNSALRRSAAGRRQERPNADARRLVAFNDRTSQTGLDGGKSHSPSSGLVAPYHASYATAYLSARHSQALLSE